MKKQYTSSILCLQHVFKAFLPLYRKLLKTLISYENYCKETTSHGFTRARKVNVNNTLMKLVLYFYRIKKDIEHI